MPIPDERLPIDEFDDDAVESAALPEAVDEEEELEFETADVDSSEEELLGGDAVEEPDTASFGFGDPAD